MEQYFVTYTGQANGQLDNIYIQIKELTKTKMFLQNSLKVGITDFFNFSDPARFTMQNREEQFQWGRWENLTTI